MPALKRKSASINLLPSDEADASIKNRIILWLLGSFRFLVVIVELVVIVGFLSRFFLDSKNADLTDEINQKKALIQSYLPFERDFKRAQSRIATVNTFAYSQPLFSDFVAVVTKNLPSDLQLTKIDKSPNDFSVLVVGKNEQNILSFVSRLKKEQMLTNINVVSVEEVPNTNLIQALLKTNIN